MKWTSIEIENYKMEIPKGKVPDFSTPWYYWLYAVLIAAGLGCGLALGSVYIL
jgi:hypothetical protein